MKIKKYKKYRFSKYRFPTRITMNGQSGQIEIGHERAGSELRRQYGKDPSKLKAMHTRFEWVWGELLAKKQDG